MSFSRADRSLVAEWWFTVDRALIAVVLILVGAGIVLSLAASPAVAVRKGLPTFHFAERHLVFAVAGVILMIVVSLLTPRQIRRLALCLTLVSLALMVWVLVSGPEINGARRWVRFAGHSFQPSELAKPGFVVVTAWLLAEGRQRPDMPARPIALGAVRCLRCLLLLQPDVGQTMLISLVWGAMFFLSGQPHPAFGGCLRWPALAVLVFAYVMFDHVRRRVDRFIDPASGDTYQIDRALQSFTEGGLLGRGPGEGTIKSVLPDAHTDFIFAVIGEEYGALACTRAARRSFAFIACGPSIGRWREPDLFMRLGIVGLALLFALQAAINMGVNVGLLPAKGMTLPFISAGGSSNLAVSR